jgi:tetratricopeptide (TPR) repeat protein
VNQRFEHLSDAQIEQFGKRASGAGPETEAWVESHLDDCSSCRSRVLEFQRTQFALLPDPKVNKVSTSDCSSEDDLRNLAAGLCAEQMAKKLKAHASNCERCGPLLQEYIEDFSDESSPEEQAFLGKLRTASPEYRKQKALEMLNREMFKKNLVTPAPVPATDWRRFFSWKWIMVPALPAVALIAVGIWYLQRDTPKKVEKWIAEAYTDQRPIEMRWPGAKWGESRETLGPLQANKPLSLLRADEVIQRQTPETLRKNEWLHLRAQSEILGGAELLQLIKDLTEATQLQPDSALMFDLAIANFRMGEVTHDRKYYEKSKDVLDEMLASSRNSSALFDRAVVEQRLNLKDAALIDLSECLQKETDRKWTDEIQQKIQRLNASSGR